jgi:hypothetical protein
MNNLLRLVFALLTLLATHCAQAGSISDIGVNAYYGADNHGYGDVIGNSSYDISGATIARAGSVLTVTIATSFAGHAGSDPAQAAKGIGYGDVFLAQTWNPFGSDAHHINDKASNGTQWSYSQSLDNRWSNTGGTFKLYKLNGATNASNLVNSETFMSCTNGVTCNYRDGQAAAVNTASGSVQDLGLTGQWSVSADQQVKFTFDMKNTDLINFSSFAMHWGETAQNDVIEGFVKLPEPGGIALLTLGMGAMLVMRRRKKNQQ